MKTQTLILKVKFDEDDKNPNFWDWNALIGCKDCIELQNYGTIENVEKEDE